jgi:hypothetical protein
MPYFRCDNCLVEYYSAAVLSGTSCPTPGCRGTLKVNPFRERVNQLDITTDDDKTDPANA